MDEASPQEVAPARLGGLDVHKVAEEVNDQKANEDQFKVVGWK